MGQGSAPSLRVALLLLLASVAVTFHTPIPRRPPTTLRAKGFASTSTKKKPKKAKKKPPPTPSLDLPSLDSWGLPPPEPYDEDRPVPCQKRSLDAPTSVAAAGDALAARRVHPVDLDDDRLEVLHLDPPVYRVRGLLSPEECGDLIALTATGRCREMAKDAGTFSSGEAARRTSTTWYARFREAAVAPLIARASTLFAGVSPDHFEELQIARYLPGEQFKWHEDAVPPPLLGEDDGGQRLATLLVYLTGDGGDASGGATCFRDLGPAPPLAVKPVAGDALLFFPAFFPSATPDGRTVHRAAPAVAEKWVSQLWLHEATYPTVILDDNPR